MDRTVNFAASHGWLITGRIKVPFGDVAQLMYSASLFYLIPGRVGIFLFLLQYGISVVTKTRNLLTTNRGSLCKIGLAFVVCFISIVHLQLARTLAVLVWICKACW